MSFLSDAAVLPGSTGLLHSNGSAVVSSSSQKRPRRTQSHAGLLAPLARLVRDPVRSIAGSWGQCAVEERNERSREDENQRQILYLRLKAAATYDDWRTSACKLDQVEGNDAWKLDDDSSEYNVELVEARLRQLDEARIGCDVGRMLFLIRTSLTRGLGGMGDLRLYKHSHIGTKSLIERYIASAKNTLRALLDVSAKDDGGLDPRYVLEQMLAARQAFGRSALLLSGGGTLGMNHVGVVKSLFEASLLPRIISGSSAGSIVCAVLCTKTDEEIPEVLAQFCYGDLSVFGKEGEEESMLRKAARFLTKGALFDISNLVRVMRNMLGDITFQEAYNRTRRILNICVSSASLYELPRLLNYVTAPNVMIWSAVAASCSVPFIFSAAQLLAKDPKTGGEVPWNPSPQRWIDGSVDNDLPMTRLAEMFNVNHFIVSQVNPHVVPFLLKEEDITASEAQQSTSAFAAGPGWLHTMANLAKGEALHRMHVLAELGIFPNTVTKARSVLSQRYSGDITIFPQVSYAHFPHVLSNPNREFMLQAMLGGERATWPKLSRIQNHCAIELALDDAVQKLRARVVFSPSQVDLRMSSFATRSNSTRTDPRRATMAPNQKLPPRTLRPIDTCLKVAGPDNYFSSEADTLMSESSPAGIDSDSDDSTTDSSADSPPSSLPTLWPSTRQLFPSASQPTTPSIASRSFFASTSPLAMTPKGPSTPELRYKRLFHTPAVQAMPTIPSPSLGPGPGPGPVEAGRGRRGSGASATTPLELDISGTKGMVRRKKRSLSTGLKGLAPPDRR
ncbi:triacylglycerol lipase [Cryomyces antarcticus]